MQSDPEASHLRSSCETLRVHWALKYFLQGDLGPKYILVRHMDP